MYQSKGFRLGPSSAPKVVRWTILATLFVTLFAILSNALFTKVFHLPSPYELFSLSIWGAHKFFVWQFLSYLFIQPEVASGFSFPLIIDLFFQLYLVWAVGSAIVEMRGKNHFIALYFGSALFIGLVAYLILLLFGSPIHFSGATASLYALLIGWVFLVPEAMLMAFLMIPVKAKWLVFGWIGIKLALTFSSGEFFSFFITAASLLFGYFYSLLVWESLSPFYRLHNLERKIIYRKRQLFHRFKRAVDIEVQPSKIYDFKTGKPIIQDDDFMDACLDKISRKGKASLTLRERLRMWRISKKKTS